MNTMPTAAAMQPKSPEVREKIESRYFKMGAVVALGELLHEGEFVKSETQRRHLRRYLASFGIASIEDIDRLGIKGIYKYSFERLYR